MSCCPVLFGAVMSLYHCSFVSLFLSIVVHGVRLLSFNDVISEFHSFLVSVMIVSFTLA